MKQKVLYSAILILLLTLCGCSAKEVTAPETVAAQTEAVTTPTELAPTEPEAVKEIIMSETYYFSLQDGDDYYQRSITLYPYACFYSAIDTEEMSYGIYSEDEGRITMNIGGESCVFIKTEHNLVLEKGSFSMFGENGSVDALPGKNPRDRYENKLRAGIYELDTSEYDVAFDKVILDIDLTDMVFGLKCFDGSVVRGTLGFEEDKLVCTYEGGKMRFRLWDNQLTSTSHSYEKNITVSDQLMFCPQVESSYSYKFFYAGDQEQEIAAAQGVVSLDSYKHLYQETFRFYTPAISKDGQQDQHGYHFLIRHYPLAEKWEFQLYTKPHVRSVEVAAEEGTDGSITFLQNGKQWNFHREGDDLRFDGGSPLIVGNWFDVKGQNYYEMELPEGILLNNTVNNYAYDALYILPGKTLEECYAAIQLDTKNQLVKIQCWDGKVLRGPFAYGDEYCNYIVFECEIPDYVGTQTAHITLRPSGHALGVSNGWMLNIGPGDMNSTFYFFPVQGVTPQETINE